MVPIGTVLAYAGEISDDARMELLNEGFLFCDGKEYSVDDYRKLFSLIGQSYGTASPGKFRVPDYRGMFLRGQDNGRNIDQDTSSRIASSPVNGGNTGASVGSRQSDQLKAHTHVSGYVHHRSFKGDNDTDCPIKNCAGPEFYTSSTGGYETRPINISVNYMICYSIAK